MRSNCPRPSTSKELRQRLDLQLKKIKNLGKQITVGTEVPYHKSPNHIDLSTSASMLRVPQNQLGRLLPPFALMPGDPLSTKPREAVKTCLTRKVLIIRISRWRSGFLPSGFGKQICVLTCAV